MLADTLQAYLDGFGDIATVAQRLHVHPNTFKGMTDAMLDWQTTRFTELAVGAAEPAASDRGPTDSDVVKLRPEQVVEIAFDGVQGSTRYPGGMALRFARVLRYRDDKAPAEADTIDTVRSLYERST